LAVLDRLHRWSSGSDLKLLRTSGSLFVLRVELHVFELGFELLDILRLEVVGPSCFKTLLLTVDSRVPHGSSLEFISHDTDHDVEEENSDTDKS